MKESRIEKQNPPDFSEGLIYVDGLVSTGNKFPDTILKINFANKKIFSINFIHILFYAVDKAQDIHE
jgi:hypothetical protein